MRTLVFFFKIFSLVNFRYGFDIRDLDPTETDFSRPIATNGVDDSLSENSSIKRPRPQQRRQNPGAKNSPGSNGSGRPGGPPGGNRNREQKQTPPRREKTPLIKDSKEFPELKSILKKDQNRGNNRNRENNQRIEKKVFDKKDSRTRKPRGNF